MDVEEKYENTPLFLLLEDLFDRIIDTVVSETISFWPYRWSLLSSCALSCREFLPRSLKHLYSKIKLPVDFHDNDRLNRRITDLNSIIQARPTIANYVQELHLLLPAGNPSWVHENRNFKEVMELIHKADRPLRKLCLQGGPGVQNLHTPEPFMKSFYRPFISANITSLHIECLAKVPTQLITECTHLEELSLIVTELEKTSYPGAAVFRPSIKRLEHNNSRTAVSTLLHRRPGDDQSLVDFSTLRNLVVHTDALGDLLFEQEIIDASKGSIEELSFSVDDWQRNPRFQAFVTLCDLSQLHSFDYPVFFQSSPEGSLADICSILNTVPEEYQSLTTVRLKLFVGFTSISPPEDLLEADWDTLASHILRISSGRPFELSLLMDYLDRSEDQEDENSDSDMEEDLDDRCEQILNKVVQERLARLKNGRITVTQFNMVEKPHFS